MDETFEIEQIVDRTLIAKTNVNVFDKLPWLNGSIIFIAKNNETIGVVNTYYQHYGELWWEILNSQSPTGYVYVKHQIGSFYPPVDSLSQEEQKAIDDYKNMDLFQKIKSLLLPVLGVFLLFKIIELLIKKYLK